MLIGSAGWVRAEPKLVHIERSHYQDLYVEESQHTRCVSFRDRDQQTCIFNDSRDFLVWEYYRAVFAAFAFVEKPQKVLVIGLGGGVIPLAFKQIYPRLNLDVVELDPAMVRVAKQFFGFAETDTLNVHVSDGRVFVKKKLLEGEAYDIIVLDAFGRNWTPEHLLTEEFLNEVKGVMREGGVFVSHSRAKNKLSDSFFATYRSVFGEFYWIRTDGCCPLLFSMKQSYPDRAAITARLPELIQPMQALHISIDDYVGGLTQQVNWNVSAGILTDSYVPGNILQNRSP